MAAVFSPAPAFAGVFFSFRGRLAKPPELAFFCMFYGWKIVAVTFVTHFISVGFVFYSYSVIFKPIAEDLGGNRLGVSMGLAVMNIATGIFAPFLGYLLDHRSIRNIMSIGVVAMSLGFFLAAQMTALWQYYVILGTLMGLGAATIGGVPGSTLVSKWFVRKRGAALGVSTMGISLSGMIMAPLATVLITSIGWRMTFVVYGVTTLVLVLPLVWLIVVNRPEDLGLHPDGAAGSRPNWVVTLNHEDEGLPPVVPLAPGDQMIDHPAHFEWKGIGVLSQGVFWTMVFVVALNFFAMGATLTHMVPHATDLGYSGMQAAIILAASAGAGVIGKLLFGWVTDAIETRYAFWLAMAFQAAGELIFLFAETYTGLMFAGLVFGFGMGGVVPLWGSLVGEAYGRETFGRVMGLMNPCMLPLQVSGVPFAGWMFDRTGNYDAVFITFFAAYAIAAVILARFRSPARLHHTQPTPIKPAEQMGGQGVK